MAWLRKKAAADPEEGSTPPGDAKLSQGFSASRRRYTPCGGELQENPCRFLALLNKALWFCQCPRMRWMLWASLPVRPKGRERISGPIWCNAYVPRQKRAYGLTFASGLAVGCGFVP